MKRRRYRIVEDTYLGYEVQHKSWYWPFWVQSGFSNTHSTLEQAKAFAARHARSGIPVAELGELLPKKPA